MTILQAVAQYWHVWLTLVGLIATWMRMQNTDRDHERRILSLEADSKDTTALLIKIDKELVEIKTKLEIHLENTARMRKPKEI